MDRLRLCREQLIATEEKYRSAIELEEDKERAAAREQERPLRDDAGVRFQQRTHSETLAKEAKEQVSGFGGSHCPSVVCLDVLRICLPD